MPTPMKHPDGLPFEPKGVGFTEFTPKPSGMSAIRSFLLNEHNVASVKRKNEAKFVAAKADLMALVPAESQAINPKTGVRPKGRWTEVEIEALAALAVFIDLGVVPAS